MEYPTNFGFFTREMASSRDSPEEAPVGKRPLQVTTVPEMLTPKVIVEAELRLAVTKVFEAVDNSMSLVKLNIRNPLLGIT